MNEYLHFDIFSANRSKKDGFASGDYHEEWRTQSGTFIVHADGLGSGTKAHLIAQMYVARAIQLFKEGFSIKETFFRLVETLNEAWGGNQPFAAVTLLKIMRNGEVTAYCYEMPPPLLISHSIVAPCHHRTYYAKKAVVHEATGRLRKGEGVIVFSDGITAAGLGTRFATGWGLDGIVKYLNRVISEENIDFAKVPDILVGQAVSHWGERRGDDCSAIMAMSRKGVILNVLSGPPLKLADDAEFVKSFIDSPGISVVAGGTSARLVARELKRQLEIDYEAATNSISPPGYAIQGVTLVTEGIVTLNQVYNLLGEPLEKREERDSVFTLTEFFQIADNINFWLGLAQNKGMQAIEFRQQGILPRIEIIYRLAEKLEQMSKLVLIKSK